MQGNHINRASFLRNKHKRMKTKNACNTPDLCVCFLKFTRRTEEQNISESHTVFTNTHYSKKNTVSNGRVFESAAGAFRKWIWKRNNAGEKTGTWWGNNYCGEVKQVKQFIWSIFIFCKQWVLKWKQNKNKSKRKQNYCVLLNGQEKKWY